MVTEAVEAEVGEAEAVGMAEAEAVMAEAVGTVDMVTAAEDIMAVMAEAVDIIIIILRGILTRPYGIIIGSVQAVNPAALK